jgi:hypothetical protein
VRVLWYSIIRHYWDIENLRLCAPMHRVADGQNGGEKCGHIGGAKLFHVATSCVNGGGTVYHCGGGL